MFRRVPRSVIVLLVILGSSGIASAQYYPTWRPSPYMPAIPLGGFYSPWGSFYFGQAQALSATRVFPNGQVLSFNYSYYNAGLPLLNNYLVNPVYRNIGGGTYGGFNSVTSGASNPGLARMQQDIGQAQRIVNQLGANAGKSGDNLDRWIDERTTPEPQANPMKAIDLALINPPEEEILSGKALNELAARIADLEKHGKKASAGLCPPDLMNKIVFAGGPAADTANALRNAAPSFPEVLVQPRFASLRTDLTEAYTPVASVVLTVKKVDAASADKLAAAVKKARDAAAPGLADASVADATSVANFFNQLEVAAKFVREPAAIGVVGPKWATVGSNVAELLQHLAKYQIRFGRVSSGDEATYFSLHRGLLAYYAALSQAKK